MSKLEAASAKESKMKLVKPVSADKTKLQSRQTRDGKTETVKTVGMGCVPVGIR